MKKGFLILSLLLTTISHAQFNDSINLFVLAFGQSNLLGSTNSIDPSRLELHGNIPQAYIYSGSNYEQLNFPNNNNGLSFGPELSLCFDYTNYCRRDIYIEKVASSGAGISAEDGRSDFNVSTNELIVNVKSALSRLKAKSIELDSKNPKFVVLFIQGERDARINTGAFYYQNFSDIITELDNIQKLDLIIINVLNQQIVNNGNGITFETLESVRQAQINLIKNNSRIRGLDMNKYPLRSDDHLHFTNVAQQMIGTDAFKTIQLYFNL